MNLCVVKRKEKKMGGVLNLPLDFILGEKSDKKILSDGFPWPV